MSFGDSNLRDTRNGVICERCRRCVTEDSNHSEADSELIAMFESDESSDDADGNYDYSFPSDKVKWRRMDEKRVKRAAKPRNKNFAIWFQTSTKFHDISSLEFVVDRTEEYKYKKDLIDDDDYLFLLSILPTLLNLTPFTRFKICRGINSILVEEINKILVEGFKNTYYWRRGNKYNSRFFKETQYSIPLAKRSQYGREAQLLLLVSDNLEYFESYRDEEYSLPGLDIDEVFIYLMCNLPIIKMYDSSQKLVIRRAINEKLIQEIKGELSNQVGIRDCNTIESENSSSQLLLQSTPGVSEADDKMELRLYINKAVKIIDHDRLKPNELLHTDQTYLFLMRFLHIAKYLKLTPKLSLFNGINGLLLIGESSKDLDDLPKPENVRSQSECFMTDQVPGLADGKGNASVSGKNDDDEELDKHLRLIEEKLQAIENRIRANEFNMELRKDGDYLFLISIYSIIKKLSQPRQIQLFNGILKLLNDVSSSRDCLFSV